MLPPYTGYAHGHHSGELSISVRTPLHTHLHARAHTHTCACTHARAHPPTHTHIHMHARTLLPCAVEPLLQGLRGPRRHRREIRRTQSHRYTHTHTHTHVHNTCKYTHGSLLQENHTSSHVGMNCIHSWSYCLGHKREEQESECVTQTQCTSTC